MPRHTVADVADHQNLVSSSVARMDACGKISDMKEAERENMSSALQQDAIANAHEQVITSPDVDDDETTDLDTQIKKNVEQNASLVDTIVHFVGDRDTIGQIVQLLAYIRHAVKNNLETDIKVSLCKNVVNTELMFDVNNLPIKDYKTKDYIEIN